MSRAIAIVGMGCRFAGAPDLQRYWTLVREGRNAFGPIPTDRWNAETFTATSSRDADRTTAPAGAFLDDVKSFPALALGIPPRRVDVMDPQQRFAIETALEAIEDAGTTAAALPRKTGVYVGITAHEYRTLSSARILAMMMADGSFGAPLEDLPGLIEAVSHVVPPRPFSAPGVLGNMAAAAVAQELDLVGPAYSLDAACASAMVAIGDAVAQLRAGQIDAALAGGAYLQLAPEHYVAFSRIGAMSTSGVCRPFDHRADGFVQGDGVGMLLLKRLDDAIRDGDRIYATLEGVALNNDGRGDGPMAPVRDGQARVIRDAWSDAGVDPSVVRHVETHGTGTGVGDVTELGGLRDVLGDAPEITLGSSKANVGHTMSAAGIAGLIKAALSIHHGELPPLANFEAPKEGLDLDDGPFRIPTVAERWDDADRWTGVSSFGFGGTNGHAVLRRAPEAAAPVEQAELILISAPDLPALRELCGRTADAIAADPAATVAGVARAWALRRRQPARAAIVAATREDLTTALTAIARDEALPDGTLVGVSDGEAPSLGFLFPGQGAQRVGMLRDVAERFPVVAKTLDRLEASLADDLDVPLTHLLWPERGVDVDVDRAETRLTATENCQPAMLAVGIALDALLQEVGVRPSVVAGHSLGEFTAAAVGGVLSPEDAAHFVARRGRAMAGLHGDVGTMAAVMADRPTVERLLVDGAVVANVNHPRQIVVSGARDAVAAVVAKAEASSVRAKPLTVSHAFHSPILSSIDSDAILNGVRLKDPGVPVASAISGQLYADATDARDVFVRHATSPVVFTDALQRCVEAGADVLLQVGAGGPLASFARGTVAGDARWIGTLAPMDDHDGGRGLLGTLGQLWCAGVDVDVRPITAEAPVASVPPSVLPREVYWSIKDAPSRRITLEGVTPVPARNAPVAEVAVPEPVVEPPEGDVDDVLAGVLAVVAKVSAYPLASLKPSMTLVDDLGFDSLMVGDLATGLAERFPGVGGIPQELLLNRPTVQDLVDFVRTGATAETVDDDAPLTAYRPTWVAMPRPATDATAPTGTWAVVGDDTLVATLAAAGHEATAITADALVDAAPSVVVWAAPATVPTAPTDEAAPLLGALGALARAGLTPHVVALSHADDPWAAGIAGTLRSLAREWPDARIKHLTGSPEALVAEIGPELASPDRTVDVRFAPERQVPGFAVDTATPTDPPGAGDVVLVTGGTRGIGLRLGLRLASLGADVILVGRRAPDADDAGALAAFPNVSVVSADVLDREGLTAALTDRGVTHLVHAAGVLADGAVEAVSADAAARAWQVKVLGWTNALDATRGTLRRATAIGSWAGRLGNRHQTAYAAANATLAALAEHAGVDAVVGEFGPWIGTAMVDTIPAPVRQAMRAEGVDFVGPDAGLDALVADLGRAPGAVTHGRRLPAVVRRTRRDLVVDLAGHPYLADHAVQGVPVLPLASVADLVAWAADVPTPFEVRDLTLYAGVALREADAAIPLTVEVDAGRAKVLGADGRLHDRAEVVPATTLPEVPAPADVTALPDLDLATFYDRHTFHGPMLQGIQRLIGLGDDVVVGEIVAGDPAAWMPGTTRTAWAIDPLALDSAMQLAAYAAFVRFGRAGTPVSMGRVVSLTALTPGDTYRAEAWFGDAEDDRFSATIVVRDAQGAPVLVAEDVVAELAEVAADAADGFVADAAATDPSLWDEVADLKLRLDGVGMLGLQNPYFHVHEGTARDTTVVEGRELVNFSSYNYIGLSGDERVLSQVRDAVDRYGTSVSASRVASGERPFHGELERELAEAQDADAALLFTAGHATNVNAVGHLFGPDDLILHDEYIHDSILQGIKLSGAKRRSFRHEDAAHLEQQLKALRPTARRCLIVVEGVYSMDGDICDLPTYVDLKRQYGCLLMVDEAHSFGVVGPTGRGVGEHHGLKRGDVDLWMGTLSKSLASCGGWLAGSEALITYLRYTAPGFVYSAGLTAANGVAALASLRLMRAEPERCTTLQSNAAFFHAACAEHGLDTGPAKGESGVVPVITGNSMHALVLSQRLGEAGINVQPIVYPAVADDAARLRFFLSSTHSHEQLAWTAETVARILAEVREAYVVP